MTDSQLRQGARTVTKFMERDNAPEAVASGDLVRNPVVRPILFSGAMVRAILNDRKTQTRRVVKPQPEEYGAVQMARSMTGDQRLWPWFKGGEKMPCPYGQTGDRIWVRETWQTVEPHGIAYTLVEPVRGMKVLFRATDDDGLSEQGFTWRSSIFMPRWASRITLQILAVRVDRLQSMARTEARDEGCGTEDVPWRATGRTGHGWTDTYAELWDSINLKRGHGWDSNPWVWVIDFARISNDKVSDDE